MAHYHSASLSMKLLLTTVLLQVVYCVSAQSTFVNFSEQSGVKTASFTVVLSTADASREIHYTTDGKTPTLQSTKYTQPIQVTGTTQIIALSWKSSKPDSLPSRAGYIFLDADMSSFSSNLPLVIIENFGQGTLPKSATLSGGDAVQKQFSVSAFYTPSGGRTSFAKPPALVTNSGVKTRGSSSSSFAKTSIGFDSWDNVGEEVDIEPLGLPSGSDWVISGARNVNGGMMGDCDVTYIRSVFMYQLSNEMGEWAPHSKAVEIFVNTDGGNVKKSDYKGIYFFMEKIGRSKDKVDIEKLGPDVGQSNPDISGGYILKVDRLDPDATGFHTQWDDNGTNCVTNYYYPKERNMPDSQKTWIKTYMGQLETALGKIPGSREYTNYLDPQACIDQWILNVMPFNVDAFMFSNFMYKPRNGTIHMGPAWDLDRSLGAYDFRLDNPEKWDSDMLADVWTYGWLTQLFKDPEFDLGLRDRWFDIRQTPLEMDHMKGIIDSLATLLTEAATRDAALYGFARGFQGEIDYLKTWMEKRVLWMDGQLGYTPLFYSGTSLISGGKKKVSAGFKLKIDKPSGKTGDIYYTLDGSDPRLVGGSLNSSATRYQGEITLTHTTTVIARIKNGTSWSCYRKTTFIIEQDLSKLKLTELNYNPQKQGSVDGDNYEFIEIKNTGTETLYLAGVHFNDGVEFTFPDNATIAPGTFVVIASNPTRYNELHKLTTPYQYTGKLDNGGETVTLADIFDAVISTVTYDDKAPWPTQADGLGFTLVPTVVSPAGSQDLASSWRSSSAVNGSPGKDDILVNVKEIIVTEVMANAKFPLVNAIELYNPNNEDVDIGNWVITNKPLLTKKWSIPANTKIGAKKYLVLYQGHYAGTTLQYAQNEFGSTLSLDRLGDEVYLYSSDGTNLTGYSNGIKLEESLEDVSYGKYTISTGATHVVPLASTTFGAQNSTPKVGPLIINQIYYNPPLVGGVLSGSEFIQVKNISNKTVILYDTDNIQDSWNVNGTGFTFPAQTSLDAGDSLYLISSDMTVAGFRDRYQLPASTQIFTFTGKLDNAGEEIALRVPLDPYTDNGTTVVPYAALEKVEYQSTQPWPDANGNGYMLKRVHENQYANDVTNWSAADGKGDLPPVFTVTVTGGSGSGQVLQGAEVSVFASDAPASKAFYCWKCNDIGLLEDPFKAQVSFGMPAHDVILSAIYTDIAASNAIAQGSAWKYNNLGTDLGSSWLEEGYNDASWNSGNTMLGTGTGVVTTINIGPTNGRYPTIYFRKSITIDDATKLRSIEFGINYDDGAVVYVNGFEVQRLNMPQGTISYSTFSSSSLSSNGMQTFSIDPRYFVTGSNTIQVEVHNTSATSSDLLFDAQMSVSKVVSPSFTDIQNITLKKGWNIVSLYVIPNNPGVKQVFPNATAVKTNDIFYDNAQIDAFNSLKTIYTGSAYLVKNSKDETITIKGSILTGESTFGLKTGWNLMGVPSSSTQPMSIVPPEVSRMKNFELFYIPGNTLNTLQAITPGNGYHVKCSNSCEVIFR